MVSKVTAPSINRYATGALYFGSAFAASTNMSCINVSSHNSERFIRS